jgi:seryl-tRNA synthetase
MGIDIQIIRTDPDRVRESQRRRFKPVEAVDAIIAADAEWIRLLQVQNDLNKDFNAHNKAFGMLMKKKASADPKEIAAMKEKSKTMSEEKTKVNEDLAAAAKKREMLLSSIGNLVDDSVPVSQDEDTGNRLERSVGSLRPNPDPETMGADYNQGGRLRHHDELLDMIGGFDPRRGAAVAGHRGYFLTGPGVFLNMALVQYSLDFLAKRGYTPMQTPFFMKADVMEMTCQLGEGAGGRMFDEDMYVIPNGGGEGTDLCLIATSEQPISAFHRNEWLEPATLPIKYAGFSTNFRKEAGSHGKDAWGVFRVHQFEKVEQFVVCSPDESEAMLETMVGIAEEFLASLGLSYRVVSIVSGELNSATSKKYDVEAWFPTLGTYRELVSASNCTDFQSRAMEVRYGYAKGNSKEKTYVHMLNSTLCATERTMCGLLENWQRADGIEIPPVLRPYMGGKDKIPYVRTEPTHSHDGHNPAAKPSKQDRKTTNPDASKKGGKGKK